MKTTIIPFIALLLVFAGQGSYGEEVLSDQIVYDCNADPVYPKEYQECEFTQETHFSPAYATCSLTYFLVETHERVSYVGNGKTVTTRYLVRKRYGKTTSGSHPNNSYSARSHAYNDLLPAIAQVEKKLCN